jgi:predicted phage baseplate assembly protein
VTAETPGLSCRAPRRNTALEQSGLAAIDEVDVAMDASGGATLTVFFTGPVPAGIAIDNVLITGGTPVKVTRARPAGGDPPSVLTVTLEATGDASTYTLRLVATGSELPYPGLDPRQAAAAFAFTAGCPGEADCLPAECPPPGFAEPAVDYLAKDYESFRQLLLDRLTLLTPQWTERHVPDLGVTLVELLAYAGDQLSYRQDAVATEAYLDTARQRVSVRRHVRLIDYPMHEGCNARAWVCVQVREALQIAAEQIRFIAGGPPGLPGPALAAGQLAGVPVASYEVFEPVAPRQLSWWPAHNEMHIWTWGDAECCLPAGTTSLTLRDGKDDGTKLRLRQGDVLILEEVLGPRTGVPADADPAHRQAVRLTRVTSSVDPVFAQPLVTVSWDREDALAFPLCISSRGGPLCRDISDVSVVRGNVVLADHGALLTWCGGTSEPVDVPPAPLGTTGCPETTGCVAAPDLVAEEIAGLAAACRDGSVLSCDDVAALQTLVGAGPVARVGLARQATADGCVTTPADAAIQAGLLDQLASQVVYPPLPVPFWPALGGRPVTQCAPYPGDPVVARAQARYLRTVPGTARGRLAALRTAALAGQHFGEDGANWLRTLFPGAALRQAGLGLEPSADPAAQAAALGRLANRFDDLLAVKLDRLRGLARRAAAGRRLGSDVSWELAQSWGEQAASTLDATIAATGPPARDALTQDPRGCLPALTVTLPAGPGGAWVPRRDLLGSGPADRHLVAEADNDGAMHLRFGDGRYGAAPPAGSTLAAAYRTGNGTAGNVPADAIARIVFCGVSQQAVTGVRNPLAAAGGVDPEPVAHVRAAAPLAPGRQLRRAIAAADYAALAGALAGVQRAAAELRWNGSWYEATVAVDALATADAPEWLIDEVVDRLRRVRRIGHDMVVTPAETVPIDLQVGICVDPQFLRAHVTAAVQAVLGTGELPDGTRGTFHPDELTFGSPVRVSQIIARVAAVAGVTSAEVTRLRRLFAPGSGALATGVLSFGALEVPRCDNDPAHPEHGRLVINARGGR